MKIEDMSILSKIGAFENDLIAIRHNLHMYPELGFEEQRTAEVVHQWLERFGIKTFQGIGGTGVVGILDGAGTGVRIGLRADMDALPMQEETGLPYSSRVIGRFHGCGHDGHTAMLLGTARYLAESRNFSGTAIFIFQPAEEGLGGARAMIQDQLFSRFPVDEIYALHNAPWLETGEVSLFPGPVLAAAQMFDIHVTGCGSHAAMPHKATDVLIAGTAIAQALQSIVSRNIDPISSAVVSVTAFNSGEAYNVLPAEAKLKGTVRAFDEEIMNKVVERTEEIVAGLASAYNVEARLDMRKVFDVLINHEEQTNAFYDVAAEIVGHKNVLKRVAPTMASEDFAEMLLQAPGCFAWIGHSGNFPLHHPSFQFGDEALKIGASLLAGIVEHRCRV